MKLVNCLSGGKTSSYIAANYKSDHNVFALVRTNDVKCIFPDKKIRQIVSDKLGLEFIGTLEDDMIRLITKRTYDAAAVTDASVSIFLNDKKLEFKSFDKYTDLYLGDKAENPRLCHDFSSRWSV